MTNQHVITPEMILNKEHITILYDNEKKINEIELPLIYIKYII